MVVDPTDYVETGDVISICSSYEYSPLNKNNSYSTDIGRLDSYFEYFKFHHTTITVDPFAEFLDAIGFPFSPVQVPFESTTVAVDPIYEFLDDQGYPLSSVHIPVGSTIDIFEHYL